MLKICLLSLFTSAAFCAVEGTYTGSGTDPYEKTTYTVTATFTKDKNGVYQVTWDEMEKGKKFLYKGTGLEQNGLISFVFQNAEDNTDIGIQVYKINGDTLEGRYVEFNKNLVGDEKLSRSKK